MSAPRATEIIFLPGFDGVAELRAPFVAALAERHPARAIGYPNRRLETLAGYARFASGQVAPESRPILVAESFSGLVAARWAASDPHVAGLVLCGAFARSPVPWASLGADVLAERLAIISAEDVSEELRRIEAPIVLVQFDDDLVIGAAARLHLESVCARATVVRFAGPHFAIEVRPRESAAAVELAVASLFEAPRRASA